jgi:predicted metal-dependent HD superfamily phosphohydrolase
MEENKMENKLLAKIVKEIYDTQGKSKGLVYHLWDHTMQVREASHTIAKKEAVSEADMKLLDAAGIVHDIGNIVGRAGHEEKGVEFAKTNLLYLGYDQQEIDTISGMIMATKFPQQPKNILEMIMADADLSLMGYKHWPKKIEGYRIELGINEMDKWYKGQTGFLESHKWWTKGAKELYDDQKSKNIDWLKKEIPKYWAKIYCI